MNMCYDVTHFNDHISLHQPILLFPLVRLALMVEHNDEILHMTTSHTQHLT